MSPSFPGVENAARDFLAANPDLEYVAPGFRDVCSRTLGEAVIIGPTLIEPSSVLARIMDETGLPPGRALVVLLAVVDELQRRKGSTK